MEFKLGLKEQIVSEERRGKERLVWLGNGKYKVGSSWIWTAYIGKHLSIKTSNSKSNCTSVQFSHTVVSDSLQPHGPQHARPPYPSPTPRVYPNSCSSSQWCHPTISPSVVPFSSYPQSFPASGSFQMSQLFTSGGHKYWSFSFNISSSNENPGLISFEMDWLDLLAVQGTLKSLLQHHSSKASILQHSAFLIVQLPHPYMTIGKTIALTRQSILGKVMFLFFNMLSSLAIIFLPRSKHRLISCHNLQWFWSLPPK